MPPQSVLGRFVSAGGGENVGCVEFGMVGRILGPRSLFAIRWRSFKTYISVASFEEEESGAYHA